MCRSEAGIHSIQDHGKFPCSCKIEPSQSMHYHDRQGSVRVWSCVSVINTSLRRDPMGIRGLPDPSRSGRAVTEPQRSWGILRLWRYRSSLLNSWASSGESFVGWSLPVLCQLCWPWSSQITSLSFPADSGKAKMEFYWKLRGSKRERNNRIMNVLPSLNTGFCIDTVRLHSSTWPHLQKPPLVPTPSQSWHRAVCGVETDSLRLIVPLLLLHLNPHSSASPGFPQFLAPLQVRKGKELCPFSSKEHIPGHQFHHLSPGKSVSCPTWRLPLITSLWLGFLGSPKHVN